MCLASLSESFNGAATFRSRKVAFGAVGRSHRILLQWGRDLSVAEGRSQIRPNEVRSELQWGRDLSVAEGSLSYSNAARISHGLQWGRDLSVAEGACLPAKTRATASFNGAATFRSRKDERSDTAFGYADLLQWGRDLSVAEGGYGPGGQDIEAGFNGAATFRSRKAR